MGGVIIVNTVGRQGRWIFERIAREGRLAVIMEHPERAIELARGGSIVGLEVHDASELVDAVASRLSPVTLVVLTAEEDCEVPGTAHRWIALEKEGALERILTAVGQAVSEPEPGIARPIPSR